MQAEAGPLLVRHQPDRADATFATIAATGRDAVVQLRRAVGSLHEPPTSHSTSRAWPSSPSSSNAFGPPAWTPSSPSRPAIRTAHGRRVAVYRIVQESLTNVVRHSGHDRSASCWSTRRPRSPCRSPMTAVVTGLPAVGCPGTGSSACASAPRPAGHPAGGPSR
ncbi:hypothetical protein NKG94_13355 [Micromonospora sp. M12]